MTDERGTVIRDNNDSSNRSNESDNKRENEERIVGSGVTLPLTLVSSLLLTLNTLLTTIIKAIPIKTIIINYLNKSGYVVTQLFSAILFHNFISYSLIVFTISQNIQHSIVPINVATNINPISITYRLYNV